MSTKTIADQDYHYMLQERAYIAMTVYNMNVLPRREYQCAYYLLDVHTAKEIAEKLNISSRTVEVYFERLNSRSLF